MATTIITKNGSGAPLAGDLTAGELAVDLTNKRLYSKDSGGTVIELGTNAGSSTFTDLTVSGDLTVDTDTLYVDSTNNRVGIGEGNPDNPLHINTAGTTVAQKISTNISSSEGNGDFLQAYTINGYASSLNLIREGTTNTGLAFKTTGSGTLTERMRIDSSGNVGINRSSPNGLFHMQSTSGTDSAFYIQTGAATDDSVIYFGDDSASQVGSILYEHSSNSLQFASNGAERMRIDSDGNVGIGTSDPSTQLEVKSASIEPLRLTKNGLGGPNLEFANDDGVIAEVKSLTSKSLVLTADPSNDKASTYMGFEVDGSERMRIDSSGNLLVGTTSATGFSGKMVITDGAVGGTTYLDICNGSNDNQFLKLGISNNLGIIGYDDGDGLAFGQFTNASGTGFSSEHMRLIASGDLLIGKSTTDFGTEGIILYGPSGSGSRLNITNTGNKTLNLNRLSNHGILVEFYKDGSTVGTISTNANSLPSDRNFKKNIKDLQLGLSFISSLKPVTYNYKMDDESDPVMTGLIAQDVEETLEKFGVAPNSMTLLQHNPVDDEKESDYQMDYSKLIPVLTKAIQEQQTMIETLQAQVAELQGA